MSKISSSNTLDKTMTLSKTKTISFRCNSHFKNTFENFLKRTGKSKSDAIRESIEREIVSFEKRQEKENKPYQSASG